MWRRAWARSRNAIREAARLNSIPQPRRGSARRVVGLTIDTTNAAEADPAQARIPDLWRRFSQERWAERLEELGAVGPTLAVYSRYESDASGRYQLLVGRELSAPAVGVAPLQTELVPASQYLTFRCPGALPRALIDGWRHVWSYFAQPHAPARAYTADLEIYNDSAPIEIWVAIQER